MDRQQGQKRGPGRPRTGRKPRIDITLSQDTLDFIDWLIGERGNLSGFIDERLRAHPEYANWEYIQLRSRRPS